MTDTDTLRPIIEALLFAANQPLSIRKIAALFDAHERPEHQQIQAILKQLQDGYSNHAVRLHELASGWQFRVDHALTPWVKRLWKTPTPRYSRALLETLALIAYRQPITRGEIEHIRGITVNSNIIRTLEEHGWIREVGHKETPGRPALLATTKQFLDHFHLKSLHDLPPLEEISALEAIGADLDQALPPQTQEDDSPTTTETVMVAGDAIEKALDSHN